MAVIMPRIVTVVGFFLGFFAVPPGWVRHCVGNGKRAEASNLPTLVPKTTGESSQAMTSTFIALTILATAPQSQSIDFVGFSRNEAIAAWKTTVTTPQDNGVFYLYTLVTVVDAKTGETVGIFRGTGGVRKNGKGRRLAESTLSTLAPQYAQALPRAQWQKLRRKIRFVKKHLEMNDSALRLQPDGDTELSASASKKAIDTTGNMGGPVGYTAIARLWDGSLTSLGRFRVEGQRSQRTNGHLEAFFSSTGHGVVLVNRFTTAGSHRDEIKVIRLAREPIATVYIGTMNLANVSLRHGEKLYKEMHPRGAPLYDKLVDRYWRR